MVRVPSDVLLADFLSDADPSEESYGRLFAYFLAGFLAHRSSLGAMARYPGMLSSNGTRMDRLEGFSRISPLFAAWLRGGRPSRIEMVGGSSSNLIHLLSAGILHGTDPDGTEYWGDIGHWSQAIVEASDVALTLWLAKEHVWDGFSAVERARVANWLGQVNGKRIPDNNWHLFVAQVNAVLAALGESSDSNRMLEHYQRAKSFYRGGGWFEDGALHGRPGFDYYNAWGFHYHLQWLTRIAPHLDSAFIGAALRDFVTTYKYFFGPEGFPIMGRSVCYRMAAPVPLIFAQIDHPDLVTPGEARRALDVTWKHFIRKGALADGNVSQGYYRADARLLESYSGPASCLWSLRSLIAAFAQPTGAGLWASTPEPLPVERGEFEFDLPEPGWTLTGSHRTRSIAIRTHHPTDPPLDRHRLLDRVIEMVTRKPRRPKNIAAKYFRSRYDSSDPFCGDP